MVSRKVFWGASNPFITGIFPVWCEILHQSLSRRMAQEESAKKGEGERADCSGGGPGAVLGRIRGRRMEGERERVPAAAALAGASRRALGKPAPHLQAQPGAGSLSRLLHLASCRNPPTVPQRAAVPAERRLAPHPARREIAGRGPGRRALTSGAGVAEDGARLRARPDGAEPPRFQGAQGNARERDSHPPGASEQRPLCSRSVPLPGRPESRGCGTGEGEETGWSRYPASARSLGGDSPLQWCPSELRQLGAPGGAGPLPAHLTLRVPETGAGQLRVSCMAPYPVTRVFQLKN